MRALLIDDKVKEEIKTVIEYAKANVITAKQHVAIIASEELPAGEDPERVINIFKGYRVVYSRDYADDDIYHNISISVDSGPTKGDLPSVVAFQEIIKEFGFPDLSECQLHFNKEWPYMQAIVKVEE